MKNNLYSFCKKWSLHIICMLLVFSACEKDVLKEKPLDFLTPSNAYTSSDGIFQGIMGLYDDVRQKWYDELGGDCYVYILKGLGTDLAYYGEDPGGSSYLSNYVSNLTSDKIMVSLLWNSCYSTIQKANVLIDAINTNDDKIWLNDAEKNKYLAEAMFFRAFTYRILVSLWGDVPLITEVVRSAKTDFVRTSKDEIYKLMEQDFTFAGSNLEQPGTIDKGPGRLTQGAAWHMLSELYLTQSKYQLAVEAASKVIDGYNYALMTQRFGSKLGNDIFGSGDVYYDLFVMGNQNLTENTEAIWVIQFEPLISGGSQNPGERTFGPAYFRMGNTPDGKTAFRGKFYNGKYTGYSDTLGRPVAWCRPTNYLAYNIWRSDWNNDIRNAKHNIKREFYYDNPASIYDKKKVDFNLYQPGLRDPIKDTCQYIFPYFMKIASPLEHYINLDRAGGGYTHKDIYAIRLAETLLIRCEAFLGLNNKAAAAADINKIRSRANATHVLPEDVTIDFILDERARELYTEEWRYFTLSRLGKLVERVRTYNDNPKVPGLNIQDYNNLWPIPQSQIDLNIDSKMEQNPGY